MRALILALSLVCVTGCSSDPEEAPEVQTEGGHHELTARYKLVLLNLDPLQSANSSVTIAPREGEGDQQTIAVGDTLDGYEVVSIGLQQDGVSALLKVKKDDAVEEIPLNS